MNTNPFEPIDPLGFVHRVFGIDPLPDPKIRPIHSRTTLPAELSSDSVTIPRSQYDALLRDREQGEHNRALVLSVVELLNRRDTLMSVFDAARDDAFALSMIALELKDRAPDVLNEVRSLVETARMDLYGGPRGGHL